MKNQTVTSIVHHHIKEGKVDNFLLWLKKIRGESSKFEGYIDALLIDSCGNKNERISIFRFESQGLLNKWLDSKIHQDLLIELKLIVERETHITSYAGLEFWFDQAPQNRMKMSLLTFIGLLPLVLYIPPVIEKITGLNDVSLNAVSTAIIVLMMTYLVMPFVMKITNLLKRS